MIPAIKPTLLSGNEPITNGSHILGRVTDFWRWAYSDLMGNTERGAVAEYLIACALGIQNAPRISWDQYDLKSKEGITIEVKTSGFLQTWEQNGFSKPSFSIAPTLGWDSVTNQYQATQKRQADVYVFCLHKHMEQETANPLDTAQWDFYVLSTKIINEVCGLQKTITLSSLVKIGAIKCTFESLYETILKTIE